MKAEEKEQLKGILNKWQRGFNISMTDLEQAIDSMPEDESPEPERPEPKYKEGRWAKFANAYGIYKIKDKLWNSFHKNEWSYYLGGLCKWVAENEITPVINLQLAGETDLRVWQVVDIIRTGEQGIITFNDNSDDKQWKVCFKNKRRYCFEYYNNDEIRPAAEVKE